MSILKVILHHWNKTTQSYDNFHPETEVSQVTDWNNGIVNTLASTGLSSLVKVLSSDSLLALLIKKVFDAMGVKYSLGTNGYVCWGALFGGVITQWGTFSISAADNSTTITIPVSLTSFCGFVGITPNNAADQQLGLSSISGNTMVIKKGTSDGATRTGRWFIVGM